MANTPQVYADHSVVSPPATAQERTSKETAMTTLSLDRVVQDRESCSSFTSPHYCSTSIYRLCMVAICRWKDTACIFEYECKDREKPLWSDDARSSLLV